MTCRLCDRPVRARGLCGAHYENLKRYGQPVGNPLKGKPQPPLNFPGRGALRCLICDEPYVEHAIGPCPKAGGRVLR